MVMRWMMAIWMAATPALAQTADAAAVLLENAARKERVAGDLKGAIAEYRKIAAKFAGRPDVAAQALVKMGQCQEKLGESEARRSYERVVKEYAGAGAYAAQARARLAAMGSVAGEGASARVVWDGAPDFWGRVSADGRYLSYVDWTTGDLAIRDLVKGESRRVTNYGGYEKAMGEVESTSLSPDGKRIVFNWQRWDPAAKQEGDYELRMIQADGSGGRTLWKADKTRYFEAYGWSPDGNWVAVFESVEDKAQIVLLAPETGERRVVHTKSSLYKGNLMFSPDGKWLAYDEPTVRQGRERNLYVVAVEGKEESMVARDASMMGWTPRGDGLVFRRGDQLHTVPVSAGRAAGEARTLHIPVTGGFPQALGMAASGSVFFGTSNRTTEAVLDRVNLERPFSGEPLRRFPVSAIGFANNNGNLRFSPDGKLLASSASVSSIRIMGVAGGADRVLTVPLAELRRFEWIPDGSAIVGSGAGRDGKIGLFQIDTGTGAATYLCPIERGMVFTARADGKAVYEMERDGLAEIDLATGSRRLLVARDFGGQGPANLRRSPDGRRLLVTTFAFIGIYDAETGNLRELHRRKGEFGMAVRGADWTADGRHVVAMVSLKGNARETWIFPSEGGEPQRKPQNFRNQDFATSTDGAHWAVAKTNSHGQVWAVENFLPAK